MAKWKCEVCGNEFENFHAQGFDNKIYCPLCYFKKENQELKLELSGYRQAILNNKEMLGLKEKNDKLKKQLEELKSTNKVLSEELTKDKILKQDCLTTCCGIPIGDIPKLINQQKKFIEYLEYQVKLQEELSDIHLATGFEEILSKYKEIIGDDK